jgi:hypothetical protein
MQKIDLIDPLFWVGEDRVLLNDTTKYGLRRVAVARKNVEPDVEAWLDYCAKKANGAEVWGWLVKREKESFYLLWIVWKERP